VSFFLRSSTLLEDLERLPAPPFFAVADMVHSLVPRVGLELLLAEARSSRVLEFLACLTDPLWISSDYLRLASCHHSWPSSPSATKPLPVTPSRKTPLSSIEPAHWRPPPSAMSARHQEPRNRATALCGRANKARSRSLSSLRLSSNIFSSASRPLRLFPKSPSSLFP